MFGRFFFYRKWLKQLFDYYNGCQLIFCQAYQIKWLIIAALAGFRQLKHLVKNQGELKHNKDCVIYCSIFSIFSLTLNNKSDNILDFCFASLSTLFTSASSLWHLEAYRDMK